MKNLRGSELLVHPQSCLRTKQRFKQAKFWIYKVTRCATTHESSNTPFLGARWAALTIFPFQLRNLVSFSARSQVLGSSSELGECSGEKSTQLVCPFRPCKGMTEKKINTRARSQNTEEERSCFSFRISFVWTRHVLPASNAFFV